MDIDVRAVDPYDDGALAAAHEVDAAVRAHDVPDFPAPCPVRYAGDLRYENGFTRKLSYLAVLDGTPVGLLDMVFPLLDNTGNADIELRVAPAYRRRGVGRALHGYAV